MKNLEVQKIALTFGTLGTNRMGFKDYITSFLPSINLQFRASDLKAKFCPLANKIYFPSFPQFCTQTEDILACCDCWKVDMLQAPLWGFSVCRKVSTAIPACRGWFSQQGKEERIWVGRLRKKKVLIEKRSELWVSGWTPHVLKTKSRDLSAIIIFFCFTEIDNNLSNSEHPTKIQRFYFLRGGSK